MPIATYNYVCFSAGRHQRQPTRTGTAGGFTSLGTFPGGMPAPGGTFQASVQPPSWPPNQQPPEYLFSFMTVSGGSLTEGGPAVGLTSYQFDMPPQQVYVGESPISVLVVYVPPGGGGHGKESGATIDAFDETAGALFNDTFVSVAPDPTGALTTSGNIYGYVDTTNSSEAITALSPTSPTDVVFSRWVNLGPPAVPLTSQVLEASQGLPVSALAFYDAPNVGTLVVTVVEDSDGGFSAINATVTANPGGLLTRTGVGIYSLQVSPGVIEVTATPHGFRATPSVEQTAVTVVAGQTATVEFVFVEKGTRF